MISILHNKKKGNVNRCHQGTVKDAKKRNNIVVIALKTV